MRIGHNFIESLDPVYHEVLKHLSRNDHGNIHVSLCSVAKRKNRINAVPGSTFDISAAAPRSWLFSELNLPFAVTNNEIDILFCHAPDLTVRQPSRSVVVLPDVNALQFDDEKVRGLENSIRYRTRMSSVKKANRVLTYSSSEQSSISRVLGIRPDRITVVDPPAGKAFAPVFNEKKISAVTERYGIRSEYYIYSGTYFRRNNIRELLDIFMGFSALNSSSSLVLAGKVPVNVAEQIKTADNRGKIIMAGEVPDQDLAMLYNGALAFLSTSSYESYCFDAQRAMACGTPTIAYATSCFPEVMKNCSVLIRDKDKKAFIKAMKDSKENQNMRISCRALGVSLAKKHSVEALGEQISSVFREISEESVPDA